MMLKKILADFLFGYYLLNYVLNYTDFHKHTQKKVQAAKPTALKIINGQTNIQRSSAFLDKTRIH